MNFEYGNNYNGSIQWHRILKENLPAKVSGRHVFFVVEHITDTVGSIYASLNDGTVKCFANAVDITSVQNAISALQTSIADMKDGTKEGSLQKQINVLSAERGYLNSKELASDYNLDALLDNGDYCINYGENSKKPDGIGAFHIHVQKMTNLYVMQEYTTVYEPVRKYFRLLDSGFWKPYHEVCTVEKLNNALAINNLTQVQGGA